MNTFNEWWQAEEEKKRQQGADDDAVLGAMRSIAGMAWSAAQTQWQPIETAPIGIWCLFLDGRGTMEASRYRHAVHVDKVLQKADSEPIHETFYNYYYNYTHWMPLPAAPQGDEK